MKIDFEYTDSHPVAMTATIQHGITVELCYDDSGHANPRDCDNPSVMYVSYPGYSLGDEQLPENGFDEIDCPVCDGGERDLQGPWTARIGSGGGYITDPPVCPRCENYYRCEPTLDEWLHSIDAIAAAPLFVYEHSGITISMGKLKMVEQSITRDDTRSTNRFVGDGAGWDTSFVGFIVYTNESLTPCCGDDPKYRTQEWLAECAETEVSEYAKYLEGDVYGFTIEDADGEHLDSCWGFIGSEYAQEAAGEAADHAVEQVEKELANVAHWAARDVETTNA